MCVFTTYLMQKNNCSRLKSALIFVAKLIWNNLNLAALLFTTLWRCHTVAVFTCLATANWWQRCKILQQRAKLNLFECSWINRALNQSNVFNECVFFFTILNTYILIYLFILFFCVYLQSVAVLCTCARPLARRLGSCGTCCCCCSPATVVRVGIFSLQLRQFTYCTRSRSISTTIYS